MIPKIIHFCWLSDDPFPESIARCIESWKKILPDYEIRKWDFNRFPRGKSAWVDEAFDLKKYAFAADYIRNYALYTEGGIYLDSDVEAIKTFNPLLHLPYFMSYENGTGCIDAGVLAAEKGNKMFGIMLDYYEGKSFVNPDGTLNTKPLPKIMMDILGKSFRITPIKSPEEFIDDPEVISVLPFDYFSPIHIETKKLEMTSRTVAIHRFAASWVSGWPKYRRMIKLMLGPTITRGCIKLKRAIFGKR